jgi:16S rRNA (cytosine967-C5)-methyltransferase
MQTVPLAANFVEASHHIANVIEGQSLDRVQRWTPAVQDLCFGCLRDFGYLDALIQALVNRPLSDVPLRALLMCALRELQRGRVAAHTVVNEAVNACERLQLGAAKGLVNASLRNYLRRRAQIDAQAIQSEPARYRHPQWWIDELRRAYPDQWQSMLEAGNSHPPMSLRVNRRRANDEDYRQRLAAQGIETHRIAPGALRLSKPCAVSELPGFAEGDVSVQDASAQYAARLLDVSDGQRVLDACAAPGGKTAHLAECADLYLLALDRDPTRAARVETNLHRLALNAEVRVADATQVERWWDGRVFDRILLDAPCSASGIARRHPDIKWLRRPADLKGFAAQQDALLRALWRLLSPGGKLLYATCSVFPIENNMQIESFLARHADATRISLPAELPADGQLLPTEDRDGFFYALLQKK